MMELNPEGKRHQTSELLVCIVLIILFLILLMTRMFF